MQNTQERSVKIGVDGKQNKPKNQTTTKLCIYEFYVAHIVPNCHVRALAGKHKLGQSSLLYGTVRHKTEQDLCASSYYTCD